MHIIERITRIDPFFGRIGLSIGNFEGFHRGHIKIIARLIAESRKKNLLSTVITFKQHPLKILSGKEPQKLWAPCDKIESFKKAGIDLLIYIDFSPAFSATMPLDFITELKKNLSPRLLCLGSSFRFGKKNAGDLKLLANVSLRFQFQLVSVDEVLLHDVPVSSTRIRNAVKAGKIGLAENMLGRKYSVYLVNDPENSMLNPFISNVALPAEGLFSGEIENLRTKQKRAETFNIVNGCFQPVSKEKFQNNQLYEFYFDRTGGSEK